MIEKLTILEAQKRLIGKMRCFFDVGIKEENYIFGRIVFEMYHTVVPRTCKNFVALCRGTNGLSYKYVNFICTCQQARDIGPSWGGEID
jgi:hypothetical protein